MHGSALPAGAAGGCAARPGVLLFPRSLGGQPTGMGPRAAAHGARGGRGVHRKRRDKMRVTKIMRPLGVSHSVTLMSRSITRAKEPEAIISMHTPIARFSGPRSKPVE